MTCNRLIEIRRRRHISLVGDRNRKGNYGIRDDAIRI
jgi:hypothetical protein